MSTTVFWKDTAERAVKTFAQSLLAVLAVGVPLWELDWLNAVGIGGTAAVFSLLTSIASGGVGDPATASVVDYRGRHRADE